MESLVQGKLARRVRWGGCRNVRSEKNLTFGLFRPQEEATEQDGKLVQRGRQADKMRVKSHFRQSSGEVISVFCPFWGVCVRQESGEPAWVGSLWGVQGKLPEVGTDEQVCQGARV